jgi:dihydroorotase
MPNTKPIIDNKDSLSLLNYLIRNNSLINVYPIAAITKEQKSEQLNSMLELKEMGAIAFSDDGHPVRSANIMMDALSYAKDHKLLIIDHCEDLNLVKQGVINSGEVALRLGLKGISSASEELPVERDIELAGKLGARVHIAHISTGKSAELIRKGKNQNIKVTCEVTPHHIALTDEIITEGYTDCKVNPPLRTQQDVDALINALVDGTIDVIATDHAPHSKDDKGEDFNLAAFGISGIETAFSVCYTVLVKSGIMSLKELVKKMSYNPAQILCLNKGRILEGCDADLALVNIDNEISINKEDFLSKGHNTPFHGRSFFGEVVYTICNGKLVYEKN